MDRVAAWLGPALLLPAGVTLVVEGNEPPADWLSLAVLLFGVVLLTLFGPALVVAVDARTVRRELARRPAVVPPRGVRAVMPDGSVVPLECVYRGWEPAAPGQHVWEVVIRLPEPPRVVEADMVPPHTVVLGASGSPVGWT